ncbi:MAG: 2,3-dehydroadipyl-CoA hydratase [Thermoanaerobaculia bacterium]|nr:2,3-dehydroadipyl-CoA hydratase [Thermoanaerobaculia bacterium]
MTGSLETLVLDRASGGRVLHVILNRPAVRNAFNEVLIRELTEVFQAAVLEASTRVVVLRGAGKAFCAGADLNWMSRMVSFGYEENRKDAEALAGLFQTIDSCEKPVIGQVHGAALGGGTGLAAVCDVVYASETALFGTTEVRLGLIPSVISPYVVRKIGESNARHWFLSGERFGAPEALRAGLVHGVFSEASLPAEVARLADSLCLGGPVALAESKGLAKSAASEPFSTIQPKTVELIARQRTSAEGQEGMKAFLEKRPARWSEEIA